MIMKEIYRTDINSKKVFKRIGCTYYQVYADNDKHIYVYDIINPDGEHRGYEIIKGVKSKNPDDSIVYRYPTDEEFGVYAWTTVGTENTYNFEMEQVVGKVEIIENRAIPSSKE